MICLKKSYLKHFFFSLNLLAALTFFGCDQIKAIGEYFHKPEQKTNAQPSTPAAENPAALPTETISKEQAPMASNVLVRIGNWSTTIEEFNERLKAIKEAIPQYDINNLDAKKLVLEELVRQQLLVEDAEQSGLAQQKDIKDAVDEFRRTIIVREAARKLTEGIDSSEDEAKNFYEQNKEKMIEPAQWHVREIVLDTQEKANNFLIELLKGANFADSAKQNSISKSAANGGDLGFLEATPFLQMENALLSLEAGNISSVFKGPDGYYIIKLEEKKGGAPLDFEKIKEQIIATQKLQKQQQAILDYIDKLKLKIKVQVNDSLLNSNEGQKQ